MASISRSMTSLVQRDYGVHSPNRLSALKYRKQSRNLIEALRMSCQWMKQSTLEFEGEAIAGKSSASPTPRLLHEHDDHKRHRLLFLNLVQQLYTDSITSCTFSGILARLRRVTNSRLVQPLPSDVRSC